MQIYLVSHTHKYGVSRCLLKSCWKPTEAEAVARLGVVYEPERGEEIEIEGLGNEDDIPVLIIPKNPAGCLDVVVCEP